MRRLPPLGAIEAFVQVARLWSIKAAAEDLALSAPALSRRVQSLERLLGRKLEEGSNDEVRCMKVSMDAVISLHRPLVWYLVGRRYSAWCDIS